MLEILVVVISIIPVAIGMYSLITWLKLKKKYKLLFIRMVAYSMACYFGDMIYICVVIKNNWMFLSNSLLIASVLIALISGYMYALIKNRKEDLQLFIEVDNESHSNIH